jgi:ATP-dependent Clp protease adapter protein ClpS
MKCRVRVSVMAVGDDDPQHTLTSSQGQPYGMLKMIFLALFLYVSLNSHEDTVSMMEFPLSMFKYFFNYYAQCTS